MDKLRILLLDSDEQALELYGKLCRIVCEGLGFEADIRVYTNNQRLLFDMGDKYFMHSTSILVIEPQASNEAIAQTVRSMGYQGSILYLSSTLSPDNAFQAFDARVFNYLVKDKDCLPRFKTVFEETVREANTQRNEFILVKKNGECRRIDLKDVRYFESMDNDVVAHYNQTEFAFVSTFKELLEERLPPVHTFIQIHRSYLVSVPFINLINREQLSLDDGTVLPVGRTNYPALKAAMGSDPKP